MGFASFTEENFRNKVLPKMELFVALAPAAFLHESQSLFIKAFKIFGDAELKFVFGKKAFLPDSKLLQYLIPHFCDHFTFACKDAFAIVFFSDLLFFFKTKFLKKKTF